MLHGLISEDDVLQEYLFPLLYARNEISIIIDPDYRSPLPGILLQNGLSTCTLRRVSCNSSSYLCF